MMLKQREAYPVKVQAVAIRPTCDGEEMQALAVEQKEEKERVLICKNPAPRRSDLHVMHCQVGGAAQPA